MNVILVIILFSVLLAVVEVGKRKFEISGMVSRKISHILAATGIVLIPYALTPLEIFYIGIAFAIFLCLSKRFKVLKSLHEVERKTVGEILFPLGAAMSALFILPQSLQAFQFGILVMGFSDGFSGMAGEVKQVAKKIPHTKKTYLGSAVFFVSTFFLLLLFLPVISVISVFAAALLSIFLTGIELVLSYGLDNIVLPVLAGYLLLMLMA